MKKEEEEEEEKKNHRLYTQTTGHTCTHSTTIERNLF